MIIPKNGHVLCKLINKPEDSVIEGGLKFNRQFLPIYEVVDMSSLSIDLELSKNDQIVTNSIPTKVKDHDGIYYLIGLEYIAAKLSK